MLLQKLSYQALLDAVSEYTKKFIRFIMIGGNHEEFQHCRQTLDSLIKELTRRRKRDGNDEGLQQQLANLRGLVQLGKVQMN